MSRAEALAQAHARSSVSQARARAQDPFSHLPPGTPVYRLLKEWFGPDDTMHWEDEEIAYTGTPNEWMEPLNEPAREQMEIYLKHLDDCGRAVARKYGREYQGRMSDLGDIVAQAAQDAREDRQAADLGKKPRVMPARKGPVPVRGDTVQAQASKRANSGILAVKPVNNRREPRKGPVEVIGITNQMRTPDDPAAKDNLAAAHTRDQD